METAWAHWSSQSTCNERINSLFNPQQVVRLWAKSFQNCPFPGYSEKGNKRVIRSQI